MARIRITLGGDILPIRPMTPLPATAAPLFALAKTADFALANFEMPLTDRGTPVQKLLNIRAPAGIAPSIAALGFDAVTIANNHAVDYGWDGLADTRSGLEAAGIAVLGAGATRTEASRPLIRDVGGVRVGVVPFSCLTPTGMSASDARPGISALHVDTAYEIDPWYQMEEPGDPSVVKIRTSIRPADLLWALDLIAATRARCDVLIVTIHWGFGSGEDLAEYQEPLARQMIEAGADVIHGHHPHAVHGIGYHRGKPILYCAGTLVGQQVFLPASPQVIALWAGMSADGFLTQFEWSDGEIGPLVLTPTTLDADRMPIAAEGPSFAAIADRLARLSAPLGAVIRSVDGRLEAIPAP